MGGAADGKTQDLFLCIETKIFQGWCETKCEIRSWMIPKCVGLNSFPLTEIVNMKFLLSRKSRHALLVLSLKLVPILFELTPTTD